MDCLLRIIKGADAGMTYRLVPGANTIGRSSNAAIRLTSLDISWEHAVILRNNDDYILENLSASGTYVDEAKVAGQVRLRPRDQIRLSRDTILRFEPVGGAGSLLAGRSVIVAAVIALVILIALVFSATRSGSGENNWNRAYTILETWVDTDTNLPPQTSGLLHEAWRLDQAEDYDKSVKLWLRLQLLLESHENEFHFVELSREPEYRNALQRMLNPTAVPAGAELPLKEKQAALVQFVRSRLTWAASHMKTSGFNQ